MPLFFRRYYPALEDKRTLPAEEILDQVVATAFGSHWHRKDGVIRFEERRGELTPDLADATLQRSKNKHVAYFLEKNPGFAEGVELLFG